MVDFLIGLAFVAMMIGPAILAWMQWSTYATTEAEALAEDGSLPAMPPDQS